MIRNDNISIRDYIKNHFPEIGKQETEDLMKMINLADKYGFGNSMAFISTAWALMLKEHGFTDEQAIRASHNLSYPLPLKK